jgi:hypothetical protein
MTEQPTPELDDLDALVQDLRDHGDEWSWDETRQRINRFAAQRVADLQGQLERMHQRYHAAIEEGMTAEKRSTPPPGDERYRQLGIDPANPNPDGSDFHLMNIVDSTPPPGDAPSQEQPLITDHRFDGGSFGGGDQGECALCGRDAKQHAPQPDETVTPAGDAGERARKLIGSLVINHGMGCVASMLEGAEREAEAFLQSERAAAASQALLSYADKLEALGDIKPTTMTLDQAIKGIIVELRALATPQESAS